MADGRVRQAMDLEQNLARAAAGGGAGYTFRVDSTPSDPGSTAPPEGSQPTPVPATGRDRKRGAKEPRSEQERQRRRSIAWDVVMVQLALVNLCLLLFDFTYLDFRAFWMKRLPVVVRLYDPVKGIEPNPSTARYVELAGELAAERKAHDSVEVESRLEELRHLGVEGLDHRSFERVGQIQEIRAFDQRLRSFVARRDGLDAARLSAPQALDLLWRPGSDAELTATLDFFTRDLEPLLARNYYRAFDRDGDYVDRGWLVDLPFLLVFSFEFYGQWLLSWRRRQYTEWWIFPLVRWYDFLGIVPLPQFRFFRLFRIGSLYMRLRRSQYSSVGEDIVSRAVAQVARMVTEEVTDRVTVRILSASQQALANGIQARITAAVLEPRRDLLVRELAGAIERAVGDSETRATARILLDEALERASTSADSLRNLPLPRALVEPVVVAVGRAVFDSIFQTLGATLQEEEGRAALEDLLGEVVDGMIEEFTAGTGERILREALVETLDHVKGAVAARDWAVDR